MGGGSAVGRAAAGRFCSISSSGVLAGVGGGGVCVCVCVRVCARACVAEGVYLCCKLSGYPCQVVGKATCASVRGTLAGQIPLGMCLLGFLAMPSTWGSLQPQGGV